MPRIPERDALSPSSPEKACTGNPRARGAHAVLTAHAYKGSECSVATSAATASQKAQISGRPWGVSSAIEPPGREALSTMFLAQIQIKLARERNCGFYRPTSFPADLYKTRKKMQTGQGSESRRLLLQISARSVVCHTCPCSWGRRWLQRWSRRCPRFGQSPTSYCTKVQGC